MSNRDPFPRFHFLWIDGSLSQKHQNGCKHVPVAFYAVTSFTFETPQHDFFLRTPAPTPRSRSSLSHARKFMGFFRNRTDLAAASASPTTYSVSDSIVPFIPAPTPRSRCSRSHTHSIHTPTLPTPTFLSFTWTQVLWFLARLTWSRASGVTTRPATRITIIPTRATQCM